MVFLQKVMIIVMEICSLHENKIDSENNNSWVDVDKKYKLWHAIYGNWFYFISKVLSSFNDAMKWSTSATFNKLKTFV